METTVSFGYWIRRQRKALDLTQQVLAERVGCSVAAIKKIEGDERRPSRQIAERLADVLDVPVGRREVFLEVARGVRPVDQLSLAHEQISHSLPSGTVTFLFTDIEGSTKLAQEHADELRALLARHREILNQTIATHHGFVFQIVGDSFSAAFDTALNALQAASEAQQVLQHEVWSPAPIKVRMGIHTGAAQLADDSSIEGPYSGYATLALTQRIMSAAHGGQILLSHATENLLRGQLPKDVSLLDLGEHKFKDIIQPVHVFQVIAPDLQNEFPALSAQDVLPNNLPMQLTSFIGREHELSEAKQFLSNTRLLTLTGPGGTGKTRLSLQIAQQVLPEFSHGVWLVELAPLTDPTLIPQTIVSVFSLREAPNTSLVDILTTYLRAKQLLLILDNCEHLIAACAKLSTDLLHVCPQIRILASSREALGISGETVYRVPSLSLPSPALAAREAIVDYESVQLFVERATAVQSHFVLQDSNASAIAQICHRLDGIPLALELAAARIAVFSPEEIASRLDDRFRLLTGGSRTALERHQTLRALIDWSYDLLSDEERILFRRLSVFTGGWTFEAAEAVCSDLDVLNLLTQLVNKSLVMADTETHTQGTRYRLPETIRQYARDKLLEAGESEQARDRHLDFFQHFAKMAEPKLRSAEQLEWLERVETEHDNLRTTLSWSLESGQSDHALELAGALGYFWELRGLGEGIKWLDEALALSEGEARGTDAEKGQRAKALYAAARLRYMLLLDTQASRKLVEESLRLWRERGDKWWMAVALEHLGFILGVEGDVQMRLARLEEGVTLAREVEDQWPLALCLVRLAPYLMRTDVAAARRIREEGAAVARNVGDKSILIQALGSLAGTYIIEGNFTTAASIAEEGLEAAREVGDFVHEMLSLLILVITSCLQGDLAKAKSYSFQALAFAEETGASQWLLLVIFAFGLVASFSGQLGLGVRLISTTETLLRQRSIKLGAIGITDIILKQVLEKAQAQLGPAAFEAAWAEGQQMTMEQALALATEDKDSQNPNGEVVKT
jgi:predicted ATPase/class 3 adenylate cyclase